jgi:hypothetical protein
MLNPLVPLKALDSPITLPVDPPVLAPIYLSIQPAIVPSVLLPRIPLRQPGIRLAAVISLHFVLHKPLIHAEFRPDTIASGVDTFQADALESRLPAQVLNQLRTVGVVQSPDIDAFDPRAQRAVFLALNPSFHLPAVDQAAERHGPLDPVGRKRIADVSQQVLVALDTEEQTPTLLDVEGEVTELDFSDTLRESTGDGVPHSPQIHGTARRSRERAANRRFIR